MTSSESRTQEQTGPAFSVRALVIGSLLAIGVNLLTPYNDYVVSNTFFVGSFLPLALILAILLLVMVGNGLYRLLAPKRAFRTGELAVMLMMLLVSCSIPSQGMMRGLFPIIASPFDFGQTDPVFWKAFQNADLPDWLYPVPSIAEGPGSDVIRYFYGRVPDGQSIPYGAWVKPLAAWGVYFAGSLLTLISLAYLLRVQWGENERLPFPLVQLQLALIEPPEPGRAMNALFRSRGFWVATIAVMIVHSLNALHLYDVRWPEIWRTFDLRPVMSEEPWRYVPDSLRTATFYFSFIGVTFFVRTRTAFSIWAIYIATQIYATLRAANGTPVADSEWADQHLGAAAAFTLGMVIIGRRFFIAAIRGAVGGRIDDQIIDRSCVVAMRCAMLGLAIMFGWMLVVGASWWMALMCIGFVVLAHVLTSRMVAESGIPYIRTSAAVMQVVTEMPASAVPPRDVLVAGMSSINGAFQTRESSLGLAQHGMRLLDGARAMPKRFLALGAVLAWTLVISYAAASFSSLTCYYSYVTPISPRMNRSILNEDVMRGHTVSYLQTPLVQQANGNFAEKPYSVGTHAAAGFGITASLQAATWRFAGWPLLPIGYLMSGTIFLRSLWLSIFIGWGAKVLLTRIGGHRLLEASRPIFIGLIFGEGAAAAVWMVVSLILAAKGADYFPYSALPT